MTATESAVPLAGLLAEVSSPSDAVTFVPAAGAISLPAASSDLVALGATCAGVVAAMMTLLWLLSVAKRDASIVDPFWGSGFVVVAWVAGLWFDFAHSRAYLLTGLTTLWGLRLSLYLLWRNAGKGEDFRYRAMREKHGANFWWVSFFTVFLLQGIIMWLVSWPVQFGQAATAPPLGWLDAAGAVVCLIGILFEGVGDLQLARFKADPANQGRVMDRGLWRYTRHPNYFGDFCVWWGLYLVAAASGAWWTLPAPLLMSFFLIRVSGVPMLEKSLVERRAGYREYVARTSSFFPWPPKRAS